MANKTETIATSAINAEKTESTEIVEIVEIPQDSEVIQEDRSRRLKALGYV